MVPLRIGIGLFSLTAAAVAVWQQLRWAGNSGTLPVAASIPALSSDPVPPDPATITRGNVAAVHSVSAIELDDGWLRAYWFGGEPGGSG